MAALIMPAPHGGLPDNSTLATGLHAFFASPSQRHEPVTVVKRESLSSGSTFPIEIVTCRVGRGDLLRIVCKYEASYSHSAHGHRGGIPHEAQVYQRVLVRIPVSAPRFYGVHEGRSRGESWIALEYLDNCTLVRDAIDATMMDAAARWLGQFHRLNVEHLEDYRLSFLKRYDADYYRAWAERTYRLSGSLREQHPWLLPLRERFDLAIGTLMSARPVIIHGEYYPKNILYRNGTIYPVDWEAAAVAIAELDLASLIESWPEDIVISCKDSYRAARWGGDAPANFERRLDAAQLYWDFRWLGERADWTHQEEQSRRFARLLSTGRRLGLL